MFKVSKLDPWSKEAVAVTVAFERMGFELRRIGAGTDPNGDAFVSLHWGEKITRVNLGKLVDVSPNQYVSRWKEVVNLLVDKSVDEIDLAEVLMRSGTWANFENLCNKLQKEGFLDNTNKPKVVL